MTEKVKCVQCALEPMFFSDNFMMCGKYDLGAVVVSAGRGAWKLNSDLLKDSKRKVSTGCNKRMKYEVLQMKLQRLYTQARAGAEVFQQIHEG